MKPPQQHSKPGPIRPTKRSKPAGKAALMRSARKACAILEQLNKRAERWALENVAGACKTVIVHLGTLATAVGEIPDDFKPKTRPQTIRFADGQTLADGSKVVRLYHGVLLIEHTNGTRDCITTKNARTIGLR